MSSSKSVLQKSFLVVNIFSMESVQAVVRQWPEEKARPKSRRLCHWHGPQVCQKPLETHRCLWPCNQRLQTTSVYRLIVTVGQSKLTSINNLEINAPSLSDLLIISRSSEFQTAQRVLVRIRAPRCGIKDEVRDGNNHVAIRRCDSA